MEHSKNQQTNYRNKQTHKQTNKQKQHILYVTSFVLYCVSCCSKCFCTDHFVMVPLKLTLSKLFSTFFL